MTSLRDEVKDALAGILQEKFSVSESYAYEVACDIADKIFSILEIPEADQDRPRGES